jgi:threonine/homoserine/homoserine lactone efflux protein
MFGVAVGFLTLLLMACFFNLYLYTKLPVFQPIMQVVGAAYMLYLTLKILGLLPSKSKAQPQALNFTTGIALQFLNVKAMLFALTITSSFIIPFFQSPVTLVLFAAFLASLTLLSTSAWTLFGTVFNRFLSKYDKPFKIVMASLLIYSALALLGVLH